MLDHNELKKGTLFILNGQPHQVVEHSLVFKGRGGSVMQTKLKNLITGNTVAKTFHQGDQLEEAEIEKIFLEFIYQNRGKYVFSEKDNKTNRIELEKEQIGVGSQFLKQGQEVEGLVFEDKIINIALPVKISLEVVEAPPATRGDRAESGTKQITLETGAKINAPMFIQQGDAIEVNTQTDEYIRRVEND